MHATLAQAWGPHPPGTPIADSTEEAQQLGAVLVAPKRLAWLREAGFLQPVATSPEEEEK